MKRLLHRLAVGVPVLLGIGAFFALRLTAPEPATRASLERVRSLRVLTLEPVDVVPRTVGYGVAEPGRTWRAVARVEGRIVALHERLRAGARVRAGEELARIDARPYEISIARIRADIAKTSAELEELAVRESNDRSALAIEEESLALAQSELDRLQSLHQQGSLSRSQVDTERRAVLTQRQSVRSLESSLALAPAQKKTAEATLAANEAALAEAELDLGYTVLVAPFDGVVAQVDLDVNQFVARGELLFEYYGSDSAEIDAEFLYGEAKRIVGPEAVRRIAAALARGEPVDAEVADLFGARVRISSGDLSAEWPARLVGSRELVDSASRALALTVAVDAPYDNARPGERPPLLKGTFCEVELRGQPLVGRIVLPRSAIRNGEVGVVGGDGRLRRRPVVVLFTQGDLAVLESGPAAGERVVVSDLGAAVDGSLVDPIEDGELKADLRAQAAADGPPR